MAIDPSGNNPPGDASAAHGNTKDPLFDALRATVPAPVPDLNADAPASTNAPASVTTLWALYAFEVIAIGILRIPHDLNLFMFAFGDRGSWLVAQYLTAHGARPTIDFGFPYGLLPLFVGRAWFALFGLTPAAFDAAMMVGGVAMAFGVARFANAIRVGRVGQLLIVLALPIAIQSSLPGLSHLLEAVALCLALGEHARGNRGAALALATAACFAKAALGYLYGFLLLVSIVAHCRRPATRMASTNDRRSTLRTPSSTGPDATSSDAPYSAARFAWPTLRRALMPAAATAVLLFAILTPVFGMRPVIASLLPLNGMKIYRSQHFSFFSPWGRTFWDPRTQPLGHYFATVAPFWLGSTIWLAFAGLLVGWRLLRQHLFTALRPPSPLAEDHRPSAPFTGSRSSSPRTVGLGIDDGTSLRPHEIAAANSRALTPSRSWSSPPNEGETGHLRDEIVFCCALLQTLFVLRFFGPPASWTYYPYVLVMGVAAASVMNSIATRVTMLLVVVAFVAQDASLVGMSSLWKTSAPSALTAGLWADTTDRAEWSTITRLITASPTSPSLDGAASGTGPRAMAVGVAGGASILFPQFEKPVGAYLVPDEATPAEIARTIERIKTADFVVRPASVSLGDAINSWPEMTRAFDRFEVIWKGRSFQVCRHR